MKRWSLAATFVLFIAACVSAAYWAMQLFKPPLRPVAAPPQTVQIAPRLDAAAALFGGRPTIAVASNFQLKGVVVAGNAAESIAILAAGGKPAQVVKANEEVAPGVKVTEVHPRYVLLSEEGVVKRVELPEDMKGRARADLPK
jgi:general secretion pathway protein C